MICKLKKNAIEYSVEIPLKLEIELPYVPAIPLLGIHTKKTELKETHVPQGSFQNCLQ